jgi:putative DNA methylase
MDHPVISPKKLIEVALPLDAINFACAKEKSIRHGHPSTLHLWWARRPLAAARAVIFSQLVNDPEDMWRCQNPGKEPSPQVRGHWTKTRARLFGIIEDMVTWENTTNEAILEKAREEIRRSWREVCELNKQHPKATELFNSEKMPGLHDPFAGGGAIPLEAQRLGLDAYASDLNPVAVLINKAMIEIPPKFANRQPVRPESTASKSGKLGLAESWKGAAGLAEDVRYYGQWMRDEAEKRIGHLYPKVEITKEMVAERPDLKQYIGETLTVIAWLWARTVKSPNPAFSHVDVPLASTFILSSKKGNEAFVSPIIEGDSYRFKVAKGLAPQETKEGTKSARGTFRCVISGTPFSYEYIDEEANAVRMGKRLMAVVLAGNRQRIYLSPECVGDSHLARLVVDWKPDTPSRGTWASNAQGRIYGFKTFGDYFTDRQLITLTTLCDLLSECRDAIQRDISLHGEASQETHDSRSDQALSYSDAIVVYLALAIDKASDYWSTICTWHSSKELIRNTFGRQAIPMTWDYAETNPFSDSSGNVSSGLEWSEKFLRTLSVQSAGHAIQAAAQTQNVSLDKIVSTDPPYYDNIGYADLSDYFYVWLRRSLRKVFPELLSTLAVPKSEELVADAYRHGSRDAAQQFFLQGMTKAFTNIALVAHCAFPVTIYYAMKQSESDNESTHSPGWETFLEAILNSGLSLTGTWPMRTEMGNRMVSADSNALASSIILVCRPRLTTAGTIGRRQFIRMLNETLPLAMDAMTRESEGLHSPVAPVDLSQAIIGPGMAIFSRYDAVLEADGSPMSVRIALQLINRFLAEDDFDSDTQFCLHWFEQYGWETGKFGEADVLARSKGTSVDGVKQAGVLHAAGGNVRLLKWAEYPSDWDPQADQRLPIWEVLHQLIRVFNTDGETGAAAVFAAVQSKAEAARQLAYRLYTLCERKNWAEDARAYNEVVTSWSGIESAAAKETAMKQGELF